MKTGGNARSGMLRPKIGREWGEVLGFVSNVVDEFLGFLRQVLQYWFEFFTEFAKVFFEFFCELATFVGT